MLCVLLPSTMYLHPWLPPGKEASIHFSLQIFRAGFKRDSVWSALSFRQPLSSELSSVVCRHCQWVLILALITLFIFLQVVHLEKITSEMGSASQANVRVISLKTTLATTLSPRVLLPAVNRTYKQIEKNWKVRSYWVLDFGEGRYSTKILKFSLKEED